MLKLAITFFLSLFFLFPGGYEHLFARTHQSNTSFTQAKLSEKSASASLGIEKNSQTSICKAAVFGTEADAIDATEIEDDDDERTSCKKFVEVTNYFLHLFYAQVAGNLNQYLKNRLPVCEHFSYTASSKYIVQRVIRI